MIEQHVNIGIGSGGVGTSTSQLLVTFALSTTGDAINIQLFNPNSPCVLQSLNLTSGNNTINATVCPALPQAGGMILIPPTDNGQTLALKGITADTGIAISLVSPTLIGLAPAPPTSFVITAGGAITGFQICWI